MKLDKRACRHAANVPLHISLNAGVLYTERVKYLVTAAVKLLGGHRVLTVYFYDCERLKTNDRMPKWVVFQGKDTFATLERDAEGNVKWRDAMLMSLADESFYNFRECCIFGFMQNPDRRFLQVGIIVRGLLQAELNRAGGGIAVCRTSLGQGMEATRDYIAGRLKNPKAAKKLMTALLKAISLLVDNPYMGAALAEKFEITTDVRYFVVSKQLIFYHVDEEHSTIEILRVLDGRTDYLSVLFG